MSSCTKPDKTLISKWSQRLNLGGSVLVEVQRNRTGLSSMPPTLLVDFLDKDRVTHQDQIVWNRELDLWLIREARARARDIDMEGLRFSSHLKEEFQKVINCYGDGCFNAVIIDIDKCFNAEIVNTVDTVRAGPTRGRTRTPKEECTLMTKDVLGDVFRLIKTLYPSSVAEVVLAAALTEYIVKRFHLVERRLFGMDGQ